MLQPPLTASLKHLSAPVAVACSGGLDSIALLHAACAVGLEPIALHIDHGIHPDSAAWAKQVEATAKQFGAAFFGERVSGLSSDMPSLENAARNARHAALARLCAAHGIKTLLLAHHANDQAETVLLNMLRGTGLGGVGMPPSRMVGSTTWLRPWLNVPRADIEIYAAQHGLNWVEDPSNTDQTLRRNAVRHTLWPVVQAVEPRALPSLLRFASIAQEAASTEQALALQCLQPHLKSGNGLDWYAASKNHSPAVQAALLRAWLGQLGCKPASQARIFGMLEQMSARTGDGLRCSHDRWDFVFAERLLWAWHKEKVI
jgi:tRNA(Ile)-lysidine synthase